MVAVVSGSGLGLFGSSASALGGAGTSGNSNVGRGNDRIYVNSATGNLIIQSRDEFLSSRGLDVSLVRTYNSQGLLDDDNGDNWRLDIHQRVHGRTGTLNASGSTVRKVFGDGREVLYTYDVARGAYVSTDGDGAHDTLTNSAGTWTWTDGSARNTETYDSNGRLTQARDQDGNLTTYGYTGALLTSITDPSGQVTTLVYGGDNNLDSIRVVSNGGEQTLTRYFYDSANRLRQVVVDLTPADNTAPLPDANADGLIEPTAGQTYVTTYTYDGTSRRVASITQSDGSSVAFQYQQINNEFRLTRVTDAQNRITNFTYTNASGGTGGTQGTATAVSGQYSTQDNVPFPRVNGSLTTPAAGWETAELRENNAAPASVDPQIVYDSAGNGLLVYRSSTEVRAQRYTRATNTWSAEVTIDSRSSATFAPSLSIDRATGNAIAAWGQSDGTANSVYAARYTASTNTWGPAQLIDIAPTDPTFPINTASDTIVTAINGARATVAWQHNQTATGTVFDLYVARFDGTSWLAPQLAEARAENAAQASIAIDDQGNITLAFQQSDGTAASLYVNRFTQSTGTWSGAALRESSATDINDPQMAFDASGNGLLIYRTGSDVRAQRYTRSTNSWAATEITLDARGNTTFAPTLGIDYATGNAIAAWVQSDGIANSVFTARYTASSNTWTAPELIDGAPAPSFNVNATISSLSAAMNNGRAVVAWQHLQAAGGTVYDVFAARFDGTSWLAPVLMESAAANASSTNVAIDSSGNAAVVFRQSDGTAESVYVARFNVAAPPPYYLVPAGATWQSVAAAVYNADTAAAGTELQARMAPQTLTAGNRLVNFPASITVTTTVPAYTTLVAGDTSWAALAQRLYGNPDAGIIASMQSFAGTTTLPAVGQRLSIQTSFSYTVGGGPAGAVTYLQTDVQDPLGFVTTYTQDAAGRLTNVLAPTVSGARTETRYAYDASGNVTSITEDAGGLARVTTLTYDTRGNLLTTRDSLGNSTARTYNANEQLLTETSYVVRDPDGAGAGQPSQPLTTRYVYDADSHLRFVISPQGRVTEHRYSNVAATDGQRTATLQYVGAYYTAVNFAEADLAAWATLAATTQGGVERVEYGYDFRGNLLTLTAYATVTAAGAGSGTPSVTRFVYDQRGQLLQTLDAMSSVSTPNPATPNLSYATTYTYDGLGRRLATTQWNSASSLTTTTSTYGDATRTDTTADANGRVTTTVYNASGEVVSVSVGTAAATAAFGTTTYAYDANGRLRIVTDPLLARQFYFYDDMGRKTGYVDADGTLTEFIYDRADALVKTIRYAALVDATTLASLVSGGQPTAVTLATVRTAASGNAANDRIARSVYNAAGQVTHTIDQVGAVTKLTYDGAGRIVEELRYATTVAIPRATDQVLEGSFTLTAHADDRRTRHFYSDDGMLLGTLDGEGYLVEYEYDAAGHLTRQIAYATRTNSSFWATGTLAQLRPAADNETATTWVRDIVSYFFYDAQGRRTGVLDGEGYLTETVYELGGRIAQQTRYDQALTYTAGASVASLRGLVAATARRNTAAYLYDGAGRVTQETVTRGTGTSSVSVVTTHTYNSIGQLLSTTRASGTTEARTTETRYDVAGRVEQELTAEGRALITGGMTQAQIEDIWNRYGVRYAYDVAGHQISATSRPNDSQTLTTLFFYDSEDRLRYEVNALGEVKEILYDAFGQVSETRAYTDRISTTSLIGGVITSTLTSRVATAAASNTYARIAYRYTAAGQVTRTDITTNGSAADNVSTDQLYNAFGERRQETRQILTTDGTRTVVHDYGYDKRGQLATTRWDPTGLNTTEGRQYDAFGRLTQVTDQRNNATRIEYDRLGRELVNVDALGARSVLTYDAFGRTLTARDALNNVTTFTYNDAVTGQGDAVSSVTVTSQENVAITTTQNRHGQTFTVTANGNTTTHLYDKNGRLTSVTDSLGAVESRTYDRGGRLETLTDARGVVTRVVYDNANRTFTTTVDTAAGGLSLVTTNTYDGQGRVINVQSPGGRNVATEYDRAGRVTLVSVDPAGLNLRTRYEYDRAGQQVTVTEGFGSAAPRVTRYEYDKLGRRTREIVDPGTGRLNLTTDFKYDAIGNLTRKIDARGNSTWYVYDAANRLTHRIDALGTVSAFTYDAAGRTVASREYATALPAATMTTLAGLDAPTTSSFTVTTHALDRVTQSLFDRDGREKWTIDAAGAVTERTFNALGKVTRERTYANVVPLATYATEAALTSALTTAGNSTGTIGADDRLTWTAYDVRGRSAYTVDAGGAVVRYTRDLAGNVVSSTAFATLRATTLATGLADLDGWAAQAAVANHVDNRTVRYWYDGAGREVFRVDGEGYLTETRHDDANRRTSTIVYATKPTVASGATLAQLRANSVVTGFNATRDRVTTDERDVAGRVLRTFDGLTAAAANAYAEYGYDAVGNRTTTVDPRGSELAERNTAWAQAERVRLGHAADQAALTTANRAALRAHYTTTRSFDAAGRELTVTDALGNIARKDYNANGDVIKVTDARGKITYNYYDAAGQLRYRVDAGGYVTEKRYNAFGDVTDEYGYANALTGTYGETSTLAQIQGLITLNPTRDRLDTKTYDTRGLLLVLSHVAETTTTESWLYNAFGQKRQYTDANTRVFEYRYDTRGNLAREILPEVEVVTAVLPSIVAQNVRLETYREYNAFGEETLRREADNVAAQRRETRFVYDRLGRQTRAELPALAVFNRSTQANTTTTPVVQQQYDSAGNLVLEIAADGGRTVSYYDTRNRRVAMVDAENTLREFDYDAADNVIAERSYDTRVAAGSDPATRPAPVNPTLYRETRSAYDARGLRVATYTRSETLFSAARLASSGVTGYYTAEVTTLADYDANGNIVRIVDANNIADAAAGLPIRSVFMYYDNQGNKILQVDQAGYVVKWDYNAQGQVARETKYAGKLSDTFLNGLSATTAVATITAAIPAGDDRITEYDYDKRGRLKTERKMGIVYRTVSAAGVLAASDTTGNVETTYEYDGNGNLTAKIDAAGRVDNGYDALGRMNRVQDPQFAGFNGRGAALVTMRSEMTLRYDAHGNIAVKTQLGNTTAENREERLSYDTAGALRQRRDAEGAVKIFDYDAAGRATREVRQVTDVDNVAHTYARYFTFDKLGRETARQDVEDEGTASVVTREVFDTRYNAHGDIDAKGVNGAFFETYIYDRLGRLFSTNKENGTPRLYVYDANGNAVIEVRAIDTDVSQVNDGSGVRPIRGPADVAYFSPANVQFTFSKYDLRNQLVETADPPMEFGTLLAHMPIIQTSGTQGMPADNLGDLSSYIPTSLSPQSSSDDTVSQWDAHVGSSSSPVTLFAGSQPGNSSSRTFASVSPATFGFTAGTVVSDPPPVVTTVSDVPTGNIRTVTQRLVRTHTETTVTQVSATLVRRSVFVRTDTTTRVTTFTRSSSTENEEFEVEQHWQVSTVSDTSTVRTEDTDYHDYSRFTDTSISYAPEGSQTGSNPGSAERFAPVIVISPAPSISPVVMPGWPTTYVMRFGFSVPDLAAFGGAQTTVTYGYMNGSTPVTMSTVNYPGASGNQSGQFSVPSPSVTAFLEVRRNGLLVYRYPTSGPLGMITLKGQGSSSASAYMRLIDSNDNPLTGYVAADRFIDGASGREWLFIEPSVGAYANGSTRIEYVMYSGAGGTGSIVNHARTTLGSGVQTYAYVQTTSNATYDRHATGGNLATLTRAEPTQSAQQQNDYLRRLIANVSEGTSGSYVIRRRQEYNAFGEVVAQIDGRNFRTDFFYNDLGKMIREEKPTTSIHQATGAPISGRPTSYYYYDQLGQLVATQDANSALLGAAQKFYNTRVTVNGRVVREVDAMGAVTTLDYDRLGNLRQKTDALSRVTTSDYDRMGRLKRTDRWEGSTSHSYDAYDYDAAGNRIGHTDALGNRETYLFDGQDRIRRHRSFEGRQTSYAYSYLSSIGGYEKTTTTGGTSGNDTQIDRNDYFGRSRYHRDLGGHEFTYLYNFAGWLRQQTGTTAATGRNAQSITYEYYGNGLVKAITDIGISSYSRFQYDLNGNRITEAYSQLPIGATTPDQHPFQIATATYDELNRVSTVQEAGKFSIAYTYDAVGNRRTMSSTYFDVLRNTTQSQNFAYAYDKMNRFTITMGTRDGAGNIVRGTTGYEIQYDLHGRRENVWSDFPATQGGAPQPTRENYTYDRIDTVRDTYIYTGSGYDLLTSRTRRDNDARGNLRDYYEYTGGGTQTKWVHTDYDRDGAKLETIDNSNMSNRDRTVYGYVNGILTSTTGTTVNASNVIVPNTASVTLSYQYEKWDTYKESVVTISATAPEVQGWRPGSSTYQYDSNGHIKQLFDSQATRTITYVNNEKGQVLKRHEVRPPDVGQTQIPLTIRYFYYLNGHGIGDTGTDQALSRIDYAQALAMQEKEDRRVHPALGERITPVTSSDFDQNFQPINANYPPATPSSYVVRNGDTLRSIARNVWGDASLWYILADANGMTGDAQLTAGTRLTVPNVVTNIHNNAETYRPYDAALALGDTSPTLPDAPPPPPPPPRDKGCGGLGMLVMIVVAVVVTVITAGAAAAALGPALGSFGAAVVGGAIGGAVGSIASQAVGIAMGMQSGFDWKGVATAALGGAIGGALFGVSGFDGVPVNGYQGALGASKSLGAFAGAFGKAAPYVEAGIKSAAASIVTQGVSKAVGLQDKFSWRGVAAAAVGGAVGVAAGKLGGAIGNSVGGTAGNVIGKTVSGVVTGAARSAVMGGRIDLKSIAIESAGNAVAGAIVDYIGNATLPEEVKALKKLDPNAGRTYRERLAGLRVFADERNVEISADTIQELALEEVKFALDPKTFTADAQDAHIDRLMTAYGADANERAQVLDVVRTSRAEVQEALRPVETTGPDIVVTGIREGARPMSALGRFINNYQDPLATLGRVGVKAGEFIANHPWAKWGLMAVEAISSPLMFAGRTAIMQSPLGEKLMNLQETVMEEVSGFVNREGRLGDFQKAKLVTSGAILGVGLVVGGVGLFARLATTAGRFLSRMFAKRTPDNAPNGTPNNGNAPPVVTLSAAQRLQQAYGKGPIQTAPAANPPHPRGLNDGRHGEQVGLNTLEAETGMRFQPLQNPSGHGADGVFIDADNGVIYVAEVKSSIGGVTDAATAQGSPTAKLTEWARRSAGPESGWRTQNPANVALADDIRAALRSGQYRVEGIQVQVGVPTPGTTGRSTVLFSQWR
jgi:YD repeat-containing protein